MKHTFNEPTPPRPCATPHSAPVAWLKTEPASQPPDAEPVGPTLTPEQLDELAAQLRRDPEVLAGFVDRLSPGQERQDGWSPFARRLFLEVLADTGRVSLACEYAGEYAGLTRQSAYALRARDPLFAASWTAACEIARAPLADALYEKALDGVTDTIMKDGLVVATRHRFDSRLSIAVLNRLDKRCDRAEDLGSQHLAVVRRWEEWIALIGKGDDVAARALLEPAPHCQSCQLPESESPTSEAEDQGLDLSDRCWKDPIDDIWMTDFPPAPDFTGYESRPYDELDDNGPYERACTGEEIAILEAGRAAEAAAERAEDEALRDAWFQLLKDEAEPARPPAIVDQHETPAAPENDSPVDK